MHVLFISKVERFTGIYFFSSLSHTCTDDFRIKQLIMPQQWILAHWFTSFLATTDPGFITQNNSQNSDDPFDDSWGRNACLYHKFQWTLYIKQKDTITAHFTNGRNCFKFIYRPYYYLTNEILPSYSKINSVSGRIAKIKYQPSIRSMCFLQVTTDNYEHVWVRFTTTIDAISLLFWVFAWNARRPIGTSKDYF